MALRAIVLDFDGVIANSEPLHLRAYQEVLAGEGIALTEREYYSQYLGYDDLGAFRAIANNYHRSWNPSYLASLVEHKAVRLEVLERDVSVLFPGAADAIRGLAETLPLAIASGALGEEIRRVLDRADLASCFAAVVAAEDTPHSKPAPDPYRRAVALIAEAIGDPNLRSRDCVAVEDSRWGLESARAAGLRTVAVTSSYDASELGDADLIVQSLTDLKLTDLERLCGD